MKKLLNKIVSIFTSLYRWFKPVPVSVKIEEPKKLTKEELAKIAFKTQYNLDADYINQIIAKLNKTHPLHQNGYNNERCDELLIQGAKAINERKKYMGPLFYEPEIVDIHNESLYEKTGPALKQIMMEDDKKSMEILKYQKRVLDNSVQVYPPSIASKMVYQPYKRKDDITDKTLKSHLNNAKLQMINE